MKVRKNTDDKEEMAIIEPDYAAINDIVPSTAHADNVYGCIIPSTAGNYDFEECPAYNIILPK